MSLKYRLILASKSPRRQALLKSLDLDFEVVVKPINESFPNTLNPKEVTEYLANKKSDEFGALEIDELLITSDTTVLIGSSILEKARNQKEASTMLKQLSDKTHQVATGVCLRTRSKRVSFTQITSVTFDKLSEDQINYYIQKYQPYDKAGAYGIQEWIGMVGIKSIEGDYYNVMGLPLNRLYKELQNFN